MSGSPHSTFNEEGASAQSEEISEREDDCDGDNCPEKGDDCPDCYEKRGDCEGGRTRGKRRRKPESPRLNASGRKRKACPILPVEPPDDGIPQPPEAEPQN